jgi:next-to-BRCA1 protein 1
MLNIDNTRALSQAELSNASESNVFGTPIEPGTEVSYRVVMKAPLREGTAISYWRLKTADGIPFGHRLWCDVQVVAPSSPQPLPTSAGISEALDPHAAYERLLARQERMRAMQQARAHQHEQQQKEQKVIQRRQAILKAENAHKERTALVSRTLAEPAKVEEKPAAELPVEEKPVEKPAEKPELKSSGMIFPQLDKESPESSTHEAFNAQPESPVSVKSTIARTLTVTSEEEFFEDAESVALHSDDDGFMTDEEYDILDVSDEEVR